MLSKRFFLTGLITLGWYIGLYCPALVYGEREREQNRKFEYPYIADFNISLPDTSRDTLQFYSIGQGVKLFNDSDLAIEKITAEQYRTKGGFPASGGAILGCTSIRFSFKQAVTKSRLEFLVNQPVRVYVGFAAENQDGQWLKPQRDWQLFRDATFTLNKMQNGLGGIYYREFPAGKVTLFPNQKGAFCLLGIEPFESPNPAEPNHKMLQNYFSRRANAYLAAARDRLLSVKNIDEWVSLKQELRKSYIESMGWWPEKTPLNAQITGQIDRPEATIEKIIFESMPKYYNTGNLYLPKSIPANTKLPAVLVVSGHYGKAKADGPHRELCLNLSKKGIIAFAVDPISQGERCYSEHWVLGPPCLLTGTSLMLYFTWDNIRAIDYLLERPEVDPQKIAITGVSGGGLQTEYLAAIDDRAALAAPTCYISERLRWLQTGKAADAEQNPWSIIRFGLNHAQLVAMAAPIPYQLQATLKDTFPLDGTRETFKEAKHIYGLYGAEEKLRILEDDAGHAYTPALRRGFYDWFNLHLGNLADGAWEEPLPVNSPEELYCTQTGQIETSFQDARWIPDFNRQRAEKIIPNRKMPQNLNELKEYQHSIRTAIQNALHINIPNILPRKALQIRDENNLAVEKWRLSSEPDITVSAILEVHRNSTNRPAILLIGMNGNDAEEVSSLRHQLALCGYAAMSIEVRGTGESFSQQDLNGDKHLDFFIFSHDVMMNYNAIMCGTSLFAGRVLDVLQSTRFLAERPEVNPQKIAVIGWDEGGLLALTASAISENISACAAERTLGSYMSLVDKIDYSYSPGIFIWNVLSYYDIPEAAACIAPRSLRLISPQDHKCNPMAPAEIQTVYQPAYTAYHHTNAGECLEIDRTSTSSVFDWLKRTLSKNIGEIK